MTLYRSDLSWALRLMRCPVSGHFSKVPPEPQSGPTVVSSPMSPLAPVIVNDQSSCHFCADSGALSTWSCPPGRSSDGPDTTILPILQIRKQSPREVGLPAPHLPAVSRRAPPHVHTAAVNQASCCACSLSTRAASLHSQAA